MLEIAGTYNAREVIERDAKLALEEALGAEVDIDTLFQTKGRLKIDEETLSLAQRCERKEAHRVLELMESDERRHIRAHSGPDQQWVRLLPLTYRGYNLTPRQWRIAAKRRLRMQVLLKMQCPVCKRKKLDTLGEHAIMCNSSSNTNLRHNQVRDLIYKAAIDAGFRAAK